MTKTEINAALKRIGFGFVKMEINHYQDKTHPIKTKGLRGGSIGPMTLTNAHMNHNQNTIDSTRRILSDLGGTVEQSYHDLTVSFPSKKGKLLYHFDLQLFKTYAHNEYDPSYMTYWLIVKSEEA